MSGYFRDVAIRVPMINLPSPYERLADCVWLPRIIAKARLLINGSLAPEYEARFCHSSGVDGQFIAFFGLTRDDLLRIAPREDCGVEAWFKGLPGVSPSRIADWNHTAVNLGRPGFPMAERLPIGLASTYKHLGDINLETVFDVLVADEKISL
jgi:uncharacterized protein DUF5069